MAGGWNYSVFLDVCMDLYGSVRLYLGWHDKDKNPQPKMFETSPCAPRTEVSRRALDVFCGY